MLGLGLGSVGLGLGLFGLGSRAAVCRDRVRVRGSWAAVCRGTGHGNTKLNPHCVSLVSA